MINREASDRDNANTLAIKDEHDLLRPEIVKKAPFYVLRLLSGAAVVDTMNQDTVIVRSCGREFLISKEAYDFYEKVSGRVSIEQLKPKGIFPPFSIEGTNDIYFEAQRYANMEANINPSLLRVFFFKADKGGCGFYRVQQPVNFMRKRKSIIHVETGTWLSYDAGACYDMIIFPRLSDPFAFGVMKALKEAKKLIVYEADDDLDNIPDWNPAKRAHDGEAQIFRSAIRELCDGMILSTEELKSVLDKNNKGHVCHNAIDDRIWPLVPAEQLTIKESKSSDKKIRILWAGSPTHKEDLTLITKAVKRIINELQSTVEFVFIGFLPEEFSAGYNTNGRITVGVDPKYMNNIQFNPGCPVERWPDLLRSQNCNIGIAPLMDCQFNRCKSEVKVLEYWGLGMPVLASKIAPYERAIQHEVNGELIEPDPEKWYHAIRNLLLSVEKRKKYAEAGIATLRERYLISNTVEEYENAIMKIARGKIPRQECNRELELILKSRGLT